MMYFERDGMAPCRPLPPLHISDVPAASLPCIIPLRVYNAFSGQPIHTEPYGSLSDFIIAIDVAHAAMEVQLALRFYLNAKVTIVKPMAMDGRENNVSKSRVELASDSTACSVMLCAIALLCCAVLF